LRTGGQILIDGLRANGCDTIFGVPGESYLASLNALYDAGNAVRYVTCRQEGGACFMAMAHGDATGEVGVCFVTRGPGATNASIGVHSAFQGSTPMIVLVGQIPSANRHREAFQELDYRLMFGGMAKWVAEIDDPARIPEFVNRAYRTARSGRPGPVVLVLPEDMLHATSDVADFTAAKMSPVSPSPADIDSVQAILADARRPLVLLGGTNWNRTGHEAIVKFCEAHDLPVAVGFRRHGLFPNDHRNYIGNIGFGGEQMPNRYLDDADLLIAIGSRLGGGTTMGFSLIAPNPSCTLIHVHSGAEELGRLYQGDLLIEADSNAFALAVAALPPVKPAPWAAVREKARAEFETTMDLPPQQGPVDMGVVMRFLNQRLPRDTFMTAGAGNAADWPNKYYTYREFRSGLAPVSGAMGFGVPAVVAAKIADRDRMAIYISGDGDFLMNGQELVTAVQYGLDPICIVIDNSMYGTIRMCQQSAYPGRALGTTLFSPDFAMLARSYGGHGETVERTEDFVPAFERLVASGKAGVIHVKVGPDHLGPNLTISDLNPD